MSNDNGKGGRWTIGVDLGDKGCSYCALDGTGAVVKQSGDRVARVHFARSAQSTHDGALLDDRHPAARAREQQPGHQSIVSGTDDDGATHTALALSMVFAHSCPGAAMIPPPGCAPAPHSQSFSIGVL